MQFLGLAAVSAIVGVAGVATANTLRSANSTETATSAGGVTVADGPAAPVSAVVAQSQPAAQQPVVQQSTPVETPVAAPVSPPASKPSSAGGFVLVEGRTKLADSIYAVRAGDSVTVNFDAYGFRTRRSAKIEQSLRVTLPQVFGRMATASLDTLGAGALVTTRDVVGTLASEGMRLTLDNGAHVRIRVLTRVVSDGPIAIGYLATIER